MYKCAICKNQALSAEYKSGRFVICQDCHKHDYISALELSQLLDYAYQTVVNYATHKHWNLIPEPDAKRFNVNLWCRATIINFIAAQNATLNIDVVKDKFAEGRTCKSLACELKVTVRALANFCKHNKIQYLSDEALKIKNRPIVKEVKTINTWDAASAAFNRTLTGVK